MAAAAELSPRTISPMTASGPVLELFRRLDGFRRSYDPMHLDAAASALRAAFPDDTADSLMRGAILLDNELRLRTSGRLVFARVGSPCRTADEATFMAMLNAARRGRLHEAAEHALSLGIVRSRELVSLAGRLAECLDDDDVRHAPCGEHAAPPPVLRRPATMDASPRLR